MNIPDDNQPCVYLHSRGQIVTVLNDEGRCIYSGDDPAEYMEKYHPGERWEVLTLMEAMGLQRAFNRQKYVKTPVRITEDRWHEQLNVLPPARWTERKFFVSECITDDLYTCCCRLRKPGGDWCYFEMVESISAAEDQICDRVWEALDAGLIADLEEGSGLGKSEFDRAAATSDLNAEGLIGLEA